MVASALVEAPTFPRAVNDRLAFRAVRLLAASRTRVAIKLAIISDPTRADAGHRERDARHKSPAQARYSRLQPQAAGDLKSLGSASSPRVQIPLPPQLRCTFLALGRSHQERQLAIIRAGPPSGPVDHRHLAPGSSAERASKPSLSRTSSDQGQTCRTGSSRRPLGLTGLEG